MSYQRILNQRARQDQINSLRSRLEFLECMEVASWGTVPVSLLLEALAIVTNVLADLNSTVESLEDTGD